MKATERSVKYFDCRVLATVRGSKGAMSQVRPVSLGTALEEFSRLIQSGGNIDSEGVGGIQSWRLADLQIYSRRGLAIALINRGDADGADQAIEHRVNRSLRVSKKRENEANAYSSHVAFKLSPNGNGSYHTLIEESVGISSARIARIFGRAVKLSQQAGSDAFFYPHPSGVVDKEGNPKKLTGFYKFQFNAHPSDRFIEELNGGELKGIEVVNERNRGFVWDGNSGTKELSRVIRLSAHRSRASNFDVAMAVLRRAKTERMDEVRVKFSDGDGDQHTLSWDVESELLTNEERFVKRRYLRNFNNRLDTAFSSINDEIRDKMFYLLR